MSLTELLHLHHPLFFVGLLMLAGYAAGRLAHACKIPRITGYLLAGMLLSPSTFHILSEEAVAETLSLVPEIGLALIAFMIGGSLAVNKLKRVGAQIITITFAQAAGAFIMGGAVLAVFFPLVKAGGGGWDSFNSAHLPVALVLGAICTATAPGAVLAIIREYRAEGPLTTMLLGVVAIDDALAIMFFAFAWVFAEALTQGAVISFQGLLLEPVIHIGLSLAAGGVMGGLMHLFMKGETLSRPSMLTTCLGFVFGTVGLAAAVGGSPLLASMMLGFVVTNYLPGRNQVFRSVETIEETVFVLFFTLAGAHLNLGALQSAGLLAVVISVSRFSGKMLGSKLGASWSGSPEVIKKYLGYTLLPTAGVTVGLALEARGLFAVVGMEDMVLSGVLGSVVLNELLTPMILRSCLAKAGEITYE